nr:MAG TPA: hypothetical protein [Caudoviricetes sp.]
MQYLYGFIGIFKVSSLIKYTKGSSPSIEKLFYISDLELNFVI